MKQILILLISVILFSCSDSEIKYHIDETTSPTDTLTYLKSDMSLLNGVVYSEFGENGKYINGKKEGIHKDWYESGQISSELEYENGIRTFKKYMKVWYEDGQLMYDGKYNGDEQYEKSYWLGGISKHKKIIKGDTIYSEMCWDYDGTEINCEKNY